MKILLEYHACLTFLISFGIAKGLWTFCDRSTSNIKGYIYIIIIMLLLLLL